MVITSSGYRSKFVAVKTAKRRKASSNRWLKRQLNDPYVSLAKIAGYRSRAAYKLLEIQEKFKLFKAGMKIIDLGAAPGGWSQVASDIIKSAEYVSSGKIVAVDLLEVEPVAGVHFIQKDFYDDDTEQCILEIVGTKVDVVMSDMAANTTGHSTTDHLRTLALCEHAFEFALKVLKPGGHFIAKMFCGGAEKELLTRIKLNFHFVKHFKPSASRKESTEVYLVALDRKVGS